MNELSVILKAVSLADLYDAEAAFFSSKPGWKYVLKRYFLSEVHPEARQQQGAVSYIVQPPLDGSGVAVWIYLVSGAEVEYSDCLTVVKSEGNEFYWKAGLVASGADSASQTSSILEDYELFLSERGMNIADNCLRTWFFVDDIDNNYAGMVRARRENFEKCGLLPQTHYLASTGICGTPLKEGCFVQMDAVAVKGPAALTQKYLYAPEYLNPTYEYGVTFERGVNVEYNGEVHTIISGTASIDNKGNVLYLSDVVSQTRRMWLNVEKLLEEGGSSFSDLGHILVYLRNREDYALVAPMFAEKFADVPYVILLAPVCRPDWLIEMECVSRTGLKIG